MDRLWWITSALCPDNILSFDDAAVLEADDHLDPLIFFTGLFLDNDCEPRWTIWRDSGANYRTRTDALAVICEFRLAHCSLVHSSRLKEVNGLYRL